ncbi:MAG: hypothetical protein ACRDJL_00025, partial [Actinomycetota bacterium]
MPRIKKPVPGGHLPDDRSGAEAREGATPAPQPRRPLRSRAGSAALRTLQAGGWTLAAVLAIAAVGVVLVLALKFAAGLIENTLDARTPEQREMESRSLFLRHALVWG